jgi:ABC-type branched-subunit amino acid transport system ATPase component
MNQFPLLRQRRDQKAIELSGGQRQQFDYIRP